MRVLGIPGLSATVVIDGRTVFSEGFGFADLEQHVPATPHTRFRIGSVSKSLTSVALGLLVEQGRLDLDAPIQRYVPSFPRKRYEITARELAGHLAGIRHYVNGSEWYVARHYGSVVEGLSIFRDDSLLAPPSTKFLYSSYGFNLLSAALEGAAGVPFLDYMHDRVFAPLGMRDTGPERLDSLIELRGRQYERDSAGRVLNAPYADPSYKWAGGGFLSSSDDLARLGAALVDGKLLKRETVEMLFTSQRTTDGKETGYGMGWFVGRDERGRRVVSHGGSAVGGSANVRLYPDQRAAIAVIANDANDAFVGRERATAILANVFVP